MPPSALDDISRRYGIADYYHGPDGSRVDTSAETKRHMLKALGAGDRLSHASDEGLGDADLPEPPELRFTGAAGCHIPDWLPQAPAWGITLQLYELRSERDWGIGDFADLAALAPLAAEEGADFIGLTPLHALFIGEPEKASPFSPSNRRFLNPLYIAVDKVPGFEPDMADQERLRKLRSVAFADYAGVAAAKLDALRLVWAKWQAGGPDKEELLASFRRYRAARGQALERHALFEALSLHMVAEGAYAGWTTWPKDYASPDAPAVIDWARQNADEIEFQAWLQWLCDVQLGVAAQAARSAGMRIGLYVDLAVGEAPDGSAVWSDRKLFLDHTTIGAPPDFFSAHGQGWGVAALSPVALRERDYEPFVELIGDASRHAGALRIDHVMALWQLFMVPDGQSPAAGAHLRYPVDSLLARLSALSRDQRTIIIGEDLGHVPEGFRDVMQQASILSYRILYFEQNEHGFVVPDNYPQLSIACLSTHDLPTLRGWWMGSDIELRREHRLIDGDAADHQNRNRAHERERLLDALRKAGEEFHHPGEEGEPLPDMLAAAVHGYVARTSSLLAGVRLADLVGETEPTNLPGTSDEYPNWRRRSLLPLEKLRDEPLFQAIVSTMRARRPRA